MAYLIDSNTLIEAKNRYYGFDFCPGYWDWLLQQNSAGSVYSVNKVYEELTAGNDPLAVWAKQHKNQFFLMEDAPTLAAVSQIATWLTSTHFQPQVQQQFLSVADPFLVACALAHGHTVVTNEVYNANIIKNIKIPNACQQFGVTYMTPFEMLSQEQARFILAPPTTDANEGASEDSTES